jgi:hypothetical protein
MPFAVNRFVRAVKHVFDSGEQPIAGTREALDRVLNDSAKSLAFRDFARTEFTEENVRFIMACRQLDPARYGFATLYVLPINLALEDRPKWIYDRFISVDGAEYVNISGELRRPLDQSHKLGTIYPCDFLAAYDEILKLLTTNTLPRFLQSPGGAQQ